MSTSSSSGRKTRTTRKTSTAAPSKTDTAGNIIKMRTVAAATRKTTTKTATKRAATTLRRATRSNRDHKRSSSAGAHSSSNSDSDEEDEATTADASRPSSVSAWLLRTGKQILGPLVFFSSPADGDESVTTAAAATSSSSSRKVAATRTRGRQAAPKVTDARDSDVDVETLDDHDPVSTTAAPGQRRRLRATATAATATTTTDLATKTAASPHRHRQRRQASPSPSPPAKRLRSSHSVPAEAPPSTLTTAASTLHVRPPLHHLPLPPPVHFHPHSPSISTQAPVLPYIAHDPQPPRRLRSNSVLSLQVHDYEEIPPRLVDVNTCRLVVLARDAVSESVHRKDARVQSTSVAAAAVHPKSMTTTKTSATVGTHDIVIPGFERIPRRPKTKRRLKLDEDTSTETYEKSHRRLEAAERKVSNREKEILRHEWTVKQRELERLRHMQLNGIKDTSISRRRRGGGKASKLSSSSSKASHLGGGFGGMSMGRFTAAPAPWDVTAYPPHVARNHATAQAK